jgi:hypothetical protein
MPTESMMSLWRVALTSNDARAIAGQRAGIELMRPGGRPDTMLAARPDTTTGHAEPALRHRVGVRAAGRPPGGWAGGGSAGLWSAQALGVTVAA